MKNKNAISWNRYFMEIAKLSAMRSKDPDVQVGCCIIDPESKHIISIGYNGLPYGYDDNGFAWEKSSDFTSDKSSFVVHAEANAVLNAQASLKGSVVYVTYFPCNECAKLLAQSRVSKIIYLTADGKHTDRVAVSTAILKTAGIAIEQYREDGE